MTYGEKMKFLTNVGLVRFEIRANKAFHLPKTYHSAL